MKNLNKLILSLLFIFLTVPYFAYMMDSDSDDEPGTSFYHSQLQPGRKRTHCQIYGGEGAVPQPPHAKKTREARKILSSCLPKEVLFDEIFPRFHHRLDPSLPITYWAAARDLIHNTRNAFLVDDGLLALVLEYIETKIINPLIGYDSERVAIFSRSYMNDMNDCQKLLRAAVAFYILPRIRNLIKNKKFCEEQFVKVYSYLVSKEIIIQYNLFSKFKSFFRSFFPSKRTQEDCRSSFSFDNVTYWFYFVGPLHRLRVEDMEFYFLSFAKHFCSLAQDQGSECDLSALKKELSYMSPDYFLALDDCAIQLILIIFESKLVLHDDEWERTLLDVILEYILIFKDEAFSFCPRILRKNKEGYKQVLKILLAGGAIPSMENIRNVIGRGNLEILRLLLEYLNLDDDAQRGELVEFAQEHAPLEVQDDVLRLLS